jgi:hypothetical protein
MGGRSPLGRLAWDECKGVNAPRERGAPYRITHVAPMACRFPSGGPSSGCACLLWVKPFRKAWISPAAIGVKLCEGKRTRSLIYGLISFHSAMASPGNEDPSNTENAETIPRVEPRILADQARNSPTVE